MPREDRQRDDVGSSSLAVVLTAPVLVMLMFAGFQAAMWNHTRAEARLVAHEAAVLVARDGVPAGQAATAASATLRAQSLLDHARADVTIAEGQVVVTISGRAPGVLRFTSAPVRVRLAVPVEGWVPL
jgi:hypothetical protein